MSEQEKTELYRKKVDLLCKIHYLQFPRFFNEGSERMDKYSEAVDELIDLMESEQKNQG